MITSIFSKSKPINFVIVITMILIGFVINMFLQSPQESSLSLEVIFCLCIVIFYVFVTDFIISKNELTQRNGYGILVFSLSVLIFPKICSDFNLLFANVLILFALRRLLILHTKRSIKKKFFDSGFLIVLASLFYSWSLLFLIIVGIAFVYYWQQEIKNALIILLSIIAVAVLLILYNIIIKDRFIPETNFDFTFSFDYSAYNTLGDIVKLTILIALYLWSSLFYLKPLESSQKMKPLKIMVFVASIIGFVIALLSTQKTGGEFVFFIFPFSVILSNYIQNIIETWFREVIVVLLLLAFVADLFL